MSPAKALRLSIARAADDLWDLAAAATGISLSEETLETAVDAIPEEGLILLLDGPDGLVGAAHLPFPIVAGLIEAQTIGHLSKTAPDARKVTRTDSAMVAPLIDEMLERFDALCEENGIAPWGRGYRFGTMMDSPRMLSLALRATDFHVIRFSLDLAALREGEAMLMMPVVEQAAAGSSAGPSAADAQALEAQILQAPTELRAVLHRLSMPLSQISALQVGEVLSIPREALSKTEVEVGPQTVIGTTRLGQVNGMRAVRMNLPGVKAAVDPGLNGAMDQVAELPGPDAMAEAMGDPMASPMAEPMSSPMAEMPQMSLAPMPDAEEELPAFAPAAVEQQDDLLGDLPDLGDLPGMDGSDDGDDGELPDLGMMPMAALPVID